MSAPVRADHFSGPTGVDHGCDTPNPFPFGFNMSDDRHWIWSYGGSLTANLRAALDHSYHNLYGPLTDLTMQYVADPAPSNTDMVAYSQFYTNYCNVNWSANIAGYTFCMSTWPSGRCNRQEPRFDRHDTDAMTDFQRRALTCHEVGHALGLEHPNDPPVPLPANETYGCVVTPAPTDTISPHDIATIDFSYLPGDPWRPWEEHVFDSYPDPDITDRSGNRLDILLQGTDGTTYRLPYDGTNWGTIQALGGTSSGGPSVVSWDGTRLDVFIRGADNALWQTFSTDGVNWSGWFSLGGAITSAPDVASWGPGRLDVFARGADGALWRRSFSSGTWGSWHSLGGALSHGPGAASGTANRIDVVVVGNNQALYHNQWTGSSWTGFNLVGGAFTSDVDVAAFDANRFDVFGRGTDNDAWHTFRANGEWANFEDIGTTPVGGVAATWRSSARLDLVATGDDTVVRYAYYDGASW